MELARRRKQISGCNSGCNSGCSQGVIQGATGSQEWVQGVGLERLSSSDRLTLYSPFSTVSNWWQIPKTDV